MDMLRLRSRRTHVDTYKKPLFPLSISGVNAFQRNNEAPMSFFFIKDRGDLTRVLMVKSI